MSQQEEDAPQIQKGQEADVSANTANHADSEQVSLQAFPVPASPLRWEWRNLSPSHVLDIRLTPDTPYLQEASDHTLDDSTARSLTSRKASANQPPTSDTDASSPTSEDSERDDNVKSPQVEEEPTKHDDTRESLKSQSLSDTGNLADVNLDDDNATPQKEGSSEVYCPQDDLHAAETDRRATDDATKEPPPAAKSSSKTLSLGGFTNALPSMPWSPNNESPAKSRASSPSALTAPTGAPPPPSRKLTSPFSWLSRNSGMKDKDSTSPPAQTSTRRNTASSVATMASNPEMMLSRLDEGGGVSNQTSLKDRFKMVRMREETGITLPISEEDETADTASQPVQSGASVISNESGGADKVLAPGTASGVSAGPSALTEQEVDWDLWQSVVYEGPAAVARTSADELNRAIATGIPNVIRGVVWQVLAQSKNEELERLYPGLVARGTEKEKQKDRNSNSTSASATTNGSLAVQNDASPGSSASSVHSDRSGSNGSLPGKTANDKMSEADRKKKEKDDAAAMQKLEKTIRRDLGARTSFSKHAAAAGLQDGLFGICKAFALYDEGVGYAQGMNFLIMPLLFNVSTTPAGAVYRSEEVSYD